MGKGTRFLNQEMDGRAQPSRGGLGAEELEMKHVTCPVILIVPRLVSAYFQQSRNRKKLLSEVFSSSTAANEMNTAPFCRIYKNVCVLM